MQEAYLRAHRVRPDLFGGRRDVTDRLLLRWATAGGRFGARGADLYARWLRPAATLRRKLSLLVAILESRAPESRRFASPPGGPLRVILGVGRRAALAAISAAVTLPVLLPVQLLSGLSGLRSRRGRSSESGRGSEHGRGPERGRRPDGVRASRAGRSATPGA